MKRKEYRPYGTSMTQSRDYVCRLVRVSFMGMEDGSNRRRGNRSRSFMVPEARVSEVFELVRDALKGLIDNTRPRV